VEVLVEYLLLELSPIPLRRAILLSSMVQRADLLDLLVSAWFLIVLQREMFSQ